nr:RICIN domain-containing protein [Acidiferrobacterales bacterium]
NGSNTIVQIGSLSQEPEVCSEFGTVIDSPINGEAFTPDPTKTYYIDSPIHNLRLASNGNSEDAYTTSTTTTGDDVEWQFVSKGNGYWHIQRAAGGNTPRLRTDNSEFADMQSTSYSGTYTYYSFSEGSISGTYFLTLPDGPADHRRLQVNREGLVRFMGTDFDGTWESFSITEVAAQDRVVHIKKRNAQGFAIDGGKGAANAQNVYLWTENVNNVNQQWIEIDRGNGYYSYQKQGTDYCIDGNNGGENRQNVYLWLCSDNNQNQHWQKVSTNSGFFKLVKRNAPGFALDGGSNGENGQNVQLYDASNTSHNLQWSIE